MKENTMSNKFVFILMDNHQAKIWLDGVEPESDKTIIHAHDQFPEHDSRADEPKGPEAIHSFLEEIADRIKNANEILIMGPGKGKASGALNLKKYLDDKHPQLSSKIFEIDNVDISRSSEKELLAHARIERQKYLNSH